jgi:hypothetical protein
MSEINFTSTRRSTFKSFCNCLINSYFIVRNIFLKNFFKLVYFLLNGSKVSIFARISFVALVALFTLKTTLSLISFFSTISLGTFDARIASISSISFWTLRTLFSVKSSFSSITFCSLRSYLSLWTLLTTITFFTL